MSLGPGPVTVELLVAGYALSSVNVEATARGLEGRSTGRVTSDQGCFVSKVLTGTGEDVERASFILEFLEERGFAHAPRLVRTQGGSRSLTHGDGALLLMELVEGEPPRPLPGTYRALGEIAGELNRITSYPFDCPVTFQAVLQEFPGVASSLRDPSDREQFLSLASRLRALDDLPRGLVHFDLTLGNAVQRPDGVIVALDWDDAGIGPRVFDASKPLISSFVSEKDHVFDEVAARAFYEGYATRITLTPVERESLVDAALFHAMRYIVWGDPEVRWQRIKWAAAHRDKLASVIR